VHRTSGFSTLSAFWIGADHGGCENSGLALQLYFPVMRSLRLGLVGSSPE
jgi:hypothetical protein